MSTKEIAYSIVEQLSEEELLGFIALFRKAYPPKKDGTTEKQRAFEELSSMIRPIPDLDDEKELAEHREEKYGA